MELHTPVPRLPRSALPTPSSSRLPPTHTAQRVRRVVVTACLVALVPALASYVATMLEPSNSSLGIRSVEWLRDHGAAGLVTKIESTYYSLEAPPKGGPALHALPRVGLASGTGARGRGLGEEVAVPPNRRPPRASGAAEQARAARRGRVAPHAGGRERERPPAARHDVPQRPRRIPAPGGGGGVDQHLAHHRFAVRGAPGARGGTARTGAGWRCRASYRHRLLATFNSGFKLADANGGWAQHGHAYAPMRDGQATFVRYADGRYDVTAWHGGPGVPSGRGVRAPEPAA